MWPNTATVAKPNITNTTTFYDQIDSTQIEIDVWNLIARIRSDSEPLYISELWTMQDRRNIERKLE